MHPIVTIICMRAYNYISITICTDAGVPKVGNLHWISGTYRASPVIMHHRAILTYVAIYLLYSKVS